MKVLDVGSGGHPRGNVNVDLFPNDRNQCRTRWNPKEVRNFVLADAHFLPFQSKVFTHVICSHALEHFKNPLNVLKEINRVCNGEVWFVIPSQFCVGLSKTHLYAWNASTLENLLSLVFNGVEVSYKVGLLFGRNNRVAKWIPLLNTLLSKFGFHPELYAICKTA